MVWRVRSRVAPGEALSSALTGAASPAAVRAGRSDSVSRPFAPEASALQTGRYASRKVGAELWFLVEVSVCGFFKKPFC